MGTVFHMTNQKGAAALILVCEHASNAIPQEYANLGLPDHLLKFHVAWDPGALKVAQILSTKLDAPLLATNYSRLLYDCNRPPNAPDAIPTQNEIFNIPGNRNLSEEARLKRIEQFYRPFETALKNTVEAKLAQGQRPMLVTIHSFVPIFKAIARKVEIGILHSHDRRLADYLMEQSLNDTDYIVQRNEPYGPEDGVTHTIDWIGRGYDLPNVMIEIRNDLIAEQAGIAKIAYWLTDRLLPCLSHPQFDSRTRQPA